jgi:diguanylate cyclase (GGDEF)-like protein/PAS domain S-box-containing protein
MDREQLVDSGARDDPAAAERRYRALVQHSNECILVVDEQLRVVQASDAVERIFGVSPEVASSAPIGAGMDDEHREALMGAYREVLAHPEALQRVEVLAPHADGEPRWIEAVLSNQLHDPAVRGVVVNFWDVSDRHRLEDRLRSLAMHDPLTGLPNRSLLFERLERAVDGLRGHGTRHSVGLLFIDLDHFKVVNDTLGHALGDDILKEVADRLAAVVRPGDTVARFGGDEFVVLCERLDDPGDAVVIAHRIDVALRRPLRVDDREFELGVSIGISYADPEAVDPLAVLQDADAAMYRAKSEGRGHWVIFDERLREEAARRQRTETALRSTRDGRELEVHYQPVVSLASGRITGVEALVRWRRDGRLVPPSEFVPIAEDTGLIVPMGAWVMRTASRQVAQWQQLPGHEDLSLAVNVSARQLEHPHFTPLVSEVLNGSSLRRGTLWLEITESLLLEDLNTATEHLERLARMGARLALDDFGTGYSSLSYLRRFPVESVKLDRSFVAGIGADAEDSAIVTAVVELAQALGKRCVAEGIETEQQYALLRDLGCDYGQGYLMSRPVPADELRELLEPPPVTAPTRAVPPVPAAQ